MGGGLSIIKFKKIFIQYVERISKYFTREMVIESIKEIRTKKFECFEKRTASSGKDVCI